MQKLNLFSMFKREKKMLRCSRFKLNEKINISLTSNSIVNKYLSVI